jgi:hypothetical protein
MKTKPEVVWLALIYYKLQINAETVDSQTFSFMVMYNAQSSCEAIKTWEMYYDSRQEMLHMDHLCFKSANKSSRNSR